MILERSLRWAKWHVHAQENGEKSPCLAKDAYNTSKMIVEKKDGQLF